MRIIQTQDRLMTVIAKHMDPNMLPNQKPLMLDMAGLASL
jgi:hypothetical protein